MARSIQRANGWTVGRLRSQMQELKLHKPPLGGGLFATTDQSEEGYSLNFGIIDSKTLVKGSI